MKIKIGDKITTENDETTSDLVIKVGDVAEESEESPTQLLITVGELSEDDDDISSDIVISIVDNEVEESDQTEDETITINITDTTEEVSEPQSEPISITVGSEQPSEEQPVSKPVQKTMKLVARRTLNGDVLIFDHKDIDIVLKLSKGKIVTFPKEQYDEIIYDTQMRLFDFLARKGVIERGAIQGGSMFMAMEAKLLESDDYDVPQIALVAIGKWIERERPYFEWHEKWEEEQERRLLEPLEGEYTEFDADQYHEKEQGGIRPKIIPFGTPGMYRFERKENY